VSSGFFVVLKGTPPGQMTLDAAVEQRRREDAKAEDTARLVFSPVPEDFT
jgi:hypothetical protein